MNLPSNLLEPEVADRLVAFVERVTPEDFTARPHSCMDHCSHFAGSVVGVCVVCGSLVLHFLPSRLGPLRPRRSS